MRFKGHFLAALRLEAHTATPTHHQKKIFFFAMGLFDFISKGVKSLAGGLSSIVGNVTNVAKQANTFTGGALSNIPFFNEALQTAESVGGLAGSVANIAGSANPAGALAQQQTQLFEQANLTGEHLLRSAKRARQTLQDLPIRLQSIDPRLLTQQVLQGLAPMPTLGLFQNIAQ